MISKKLKLFAMILIASTFEMTASQLSRDQFEQKIDEMMFVNSDVRESIQKIDPESFEVYLKILEVFKKVIEDNYVDSDNSAPYMNSSSDSDSSSSDRSDSDSSSSDRFDSEERIVNDNKRKPRLSVDDRRKQIVEKRKQRYISNNLRAIFESLTYTSSFANNSDAPVLVRHNFFDYSSLVDQLIPGASLESRLHMLLALYKNPKFEVSAEFVDVAKKLIQSDTSDKLYNSEAVSGLTSVPSGRINAEFARFVQNVIRDLGGEVSIYSLIKDLGNVDPSNYSRFGDLINSFSTSLGISKKKSVELLSKISGQHYNDYLSNARALLASVTDSWTKERILENFINVPSAKYSHFKDMYNLMCRLYIASQGKLTDFDRIGIVGNLVKLAI